MLLPLSRPIGRRQLQLEPLVQHMDTDATQKIQKRIHNQSIDIDDLCIADPDPLRGLLERCPPIQLLDRLHYGIKFVEFPSARALSIKIWVEISTKFRQDIAGFVFERY